MGPLRLSDSDGNHPVLFWTPGSWAEVAKAVTQWQTVGGGQAQAQWTRGERQ